MNAQKLRWVLVFVLVVFAGLNVAGYTMLSKLLAQKHQAADHALIDADIARTNKESLQKLQIQLANSADTVSKAKQIVGTQTDYKYQDQAIGDLNKLAATYGIQITGYSFPDPTKATAVVPVTPALSRALPKGVKQIAVHIDTAGTVKYENYLKFLRSIELNLTRLQLTGIDVVPSGNNYVTNQSVDIQMYVRQ